AVSAVLPGAAEHGIMTVLRTLRIEQRGKCAAAGQRRLRNAEHRRGVGAPLEFVGDAIPGIGRFAAGQQRGRDFGLRKHRRCRRNAMAVNGLEPRRTRWIDHVFAPRETFLFDGSSTRRPLTPRDGAIPEWNGPAGSALATT